MSPRRRVLVVDDDEISRDLLGAMLDRMDFEVTEARDGKSALIAAEDRFDLILMDLKLPDMNGAQVLTRLRSTPDGPKVKIIIISGTQIDEGLEICRDVGCDGYLAKPFTFKQLVKMVDSVLAGSL